MTTYYTKKGRRYTPVAEHDHGVLDSLPYGCHLVIVEKGSLSRKYKIDPAFAPLIAAGHYSKDQMCSAMQKASEARPKKTPVSEKEREAWKQLQEALGDDTFYLTYPSLYEIAEAGVTAMQEEANAMLANPAVAKAYENFLTVYRLAKEHSTEE